jgi:hypothetical protein
MRYDYAASADLCEEHGLVDSAKILRAVAGGKCVAYMVRPDVYRVQLGEISGPLVEAVDRTRRLFLDREAAERHAIDLKAAFLREFSPPPYERPYMLKVPEPEFCRRVSAILKVDYRLPDALPATLFPGWASHEQLREIAPLFSAEFFEVVAVSMVPEEEP